MLISISIDNILDCVRLIHYSFVDLGIEDIIVIQRIVFPFLESNEISMLSLILDLKQFSRHYFINIINQMNKQAEEAYIKQYFQKCLQIKGVENVIAFDSDGTPRCSTFEIYKTIYLIGLVQDLIFKAQHTIEIIENGEEPFISMRLRTHNYELLITKDLADLYFVVFQNAVGNRSHRRNWF